MSVAVITPSLPDRHEMRDRCARSVAAQTVLPDVHLIGIDYREIGGGPMRNKLATAANHLGCEWVIPLDDDDELDPGYIDAVWTHARDDVDVVVAPGRAYPETMRDPPLAAPPHIPVTALIRLSLLFRIGGWWKMDPRAKPWRTDNDFWRRAVGAGANFVGIQERLWTYHAHGSNQHFGHDPVHSRG